MKWKGHLARDVPPGCTLVLNLVHPGLSYHVICLCIYKTGKIHVDTLYSVSPGCGGVGAHNVKLLHPHLGNSCIRPCFEVSNFIDQIYHLHGKLEIKLSFL